MPDKILYQASAEADFDHLGPPYEIPDKPAYHPVISSITTETPVHARILNDIIRILLQNTQAVKDIADSKAGTGIATAERDGLMSSEDKALYDAAVQAVDALAALFPEGGVLGGDLEGVLPNPTIRAGVLEGKSQTFSQAAARSNLVSGETPGTIYGKLMKWFVDLRPVAWSGSYDDLTGKPGSMPPTAHTHDERYYTENETDTKLATKAGKSTVLSKTITTSWNGSATPYTQSIAVEGATAGNIVEISLASSATVDQAEEYQALGLQDGGQGAGSITIRAFGEKNTVGIPITVIVRGDL